MRTITKGAEPPSLTAHRKTPHCDYDNYRDKTALREALVAEQGGICCYCMGRIENGPTTMKIEHWHSRSHFPAEELDYRNLLGACRGGEGQPSHLQHCDTRKGDQELLYNPADPTHHIETRIRYEADGRIRADEEAFDRQLEEVLNLNVSFLKNNRKKLLDAILDWWRHEKRPVPKARFERERERWAGGSGQLRPYCQVVVWWLEQRLAGMRR